MYIYENISLNSSWNEKYFRQKLWSATRFLISINFYLKNSAVYEKMWKTVVQLDRPLLLVQGYS